MKNKNLYLVGILIAFFLGVGGTVLLLDNTTIGKEKIIEKTEKIQDKARDFLKALRQ